MTGISILLVAAMLEIGGDAAMRRGLVERAWPWLSAGAVSLALYGLVVNLDHGREFGRLMGTYIAVFFVVSQVVGYVLFGERPSSSILCGGVLIVVGGAVIQLGRW